LLSNHPNRFFPVQTETSQKINRSMTKRQQTFSRRTLIKATATTACYAFGHSAIGEQGRKIRIAQIGTSHSHAAGKLNAVLNQRDTFELVGIAEPIVSRLPAAKAHPTFKDLHWLSEQELLSDPSIQAVVVETTLEDSPRAALACIQAGKHVHLDKPGAARHADFVEFRKLADQSGLTVQMGYMLRYNPAFELLFHVHRSGWLGNITEIHASMGKLADSRLLQELATLPGHGMFELGCHLVDAVVYLLGEPSEVHPLGKPTGLAAETKLGQSIPDNQIAVLEYPSALATIRCNHGDPFGGQHRRFHVVGTKGAIDIDPLESGRVTLSLAEENDWSRLLQRFPEIASIRKGINRLELKVPSGRYDGEFIDLAEVIRGVKRLDWTAEHDIAVHATALRCAGLTP
jgi:predicted dehydrogenase